MDAVRWQSWDGDGLEHCVCQQSANGMTLEGVVVGTRQGRYGGRYLVRTDTEFRTREVRVEYLGGPRLHVEADAEGHWQEVIGRTPIPGLDGCIDVDIGMTPATNMLPIRRLNLKARESRDILAAYIPLPNQVDGRFLPESAAQRYTCLIPKRRYLYEGMFRAFTAELEVDESGLVLDYPETFKRIANAA